MENPDRPAPDDGGTRQFLPGSSSLAVLLIVFLTLALLTLFSIMRGGAGDVASDAGGTRAYSPERFSGDRFRSGTPAGGRGGWSLRHLRNVPGETTSGVRGLLTRAPTATAKWTSTPSAASWWRCTTTSSSTTGPKSRWCFDCHNPDDRDSLRLVDGTLIGFEESYRLCGQCHGTIYRDWREGIHGRREGYWSGAKSYQLCAHCHNPHAPRFTAIEPLPPPLRPQFLRAAAEGDVADSLSEEGHRE